MKRFFLGISFLFYWLSGLAIVRPAPLISDGMVLQQQTKARLWGWASPNKKILIKTSWSEKEIRCVADKKGRWEAFINTPEASFQTQELTISDGQHLVIRNILIGEVWLASGQSNMSLPLSGTANCPVENSESHIRNANSMSGKIRLAQLPVRFSLSQPDTISVHWKDCSSATAASFGAVSYFFAKELQEMLHCPVGIINCSCDGSRIECWLPREITATYNDERILPSQAKNPNNNTLSSLYGGMLHPIVGFPIRAFAWYQGESNVWNYYTYEMRFSQLIKTWRTLWNDENKPFLFVEITPYSYTGRARNFSGWFRDVQHKIAKTVPGTAIVGTNDLVTPAEASQIHPSKKFEVGQRLARLAMNRVYGHQPPFPECPELVDAQREGTTIRLSFKNLDKGFAPTDSLIGFEICGPDNIFVPAQTRNEGNQLWLSSPLIPAPKGVRYCFHDFQIGNAKNQASLPLLSFQLFLDK